MIQLNFSILLIISVPLWLGIRFNRHLKRKEDLNRNRELLLNLFFIYLLAVAYLTLYPFSFNIPFLAGAKGHYHFDFMLFYYLRHMTDPNLQLLYSLGNILMFVPLGFMGPLLFKFPQRFQNLVLLGFTCSLTIELTQTFFTVTRRGTLDDLVFNTSGTAIGFMLFLIIKLFSTKITPFDKLMNVSR